MTPVQLFDLRAVNADINAIPYSALPKTGEPPDEWKDAPDGGSWECRDYVLAKSERLRALGWPQSTLTLVTCYAETGERHGVLCASDGTDDWILDNRASDIYRRDQAPYHYRAESRQIPGTLDLAALPENWFTVGQ